MMIMNISEPDEVKQAKRDLERKLAEALESGPAIPMTHDDWVALRQEALDGILADTIKKPNVQEDLDVEMGTD